MRILSVVGARPQFIKAAPISSILRKEHDEFLVHTGQHYDQNMSDIFFQELGIPKPNTNLGIGSGTHVEQVGGMMGLLEECIKDYKPDIVLVYGDTNSTIAAALTASYLDFPLAHIEAGLRSFNRKMPEEINRIVADHLSTLLFCPTETAVTNLHKEGVVQGVYLVGDVMFDAILKNITIARENSKIHENLGLSPNRPYIVLTIHRPDNADSVERMMAIISGLNQTNLPIVFPIHPRTRRTLDQIDIKPQGQLLIIEPIGYLDMLCLVEGSVAVVTDSGGLQKESYLLKVPTITVRSETEWIETVISGWNTLVEPEPSMILKAVSQAMYGQPDENPDFYGDGRTAARIVNTLVDYTGKNGAQ